MGRPPCCDKSNVKRGLWTEEEDLKLIAYTNTHGVGNWTSVPRKAGLKRCGKSCRLRWTNYLRPNLKHESFTPQEEEMIVTLHATIGSRWSIIANHLPGRTDNDIKNHWNTKLSKRLYQQGIDPVTHKPISQIMESIGNLSATQSHQYRRAVLPLDGRISCLSRDLKNVFLSKPAAVPAVPNAFEVLQQQPFSITTTLDEGSSSSSSTTAATALCADVSQDELKWRDFLVDDVFLSYNQDDGSSCAQLSNNVGVSGVMNENWMVAGNGKEQVVEEEVSSTLFGGPDHGGSCSTSFVDAILDQEREMMMEFPEFFCDPDSLP